MSSQFENNCHKTKRGKLKALSMFINKVVYVFYLQTVLSVSIFTNQDVI